MQVTRVVELRFRKSLSLQYYCKLDVWYIEFVTLANSATRSWTCSPTKMTTHPQANLDPTTPTPQDPKPFFPKPKTTTELLLLGFPSTDAGSEILSFPHEPSIPGGIGARISLENKVGTCLRNLQLLLGAFDCILLWQTQYFQFAVVLRHTPS